MNRKTIRITAELQAYIDYLTNLLNISENDAIKYIIYNALKSDFNYLKK